MNALKAVYDGKVFVPIEPCSISVGCMVSVSFASKRELSKSKKRLAAFRKLTEELHEANKISPIAAEFDEIISKRVNFRERVEL
jgi:predicted DNA-binding antitoxin AbrB/MazE fold protein